MGSCYAPFHTFKNPCSKCFSFKQFGTITYTIIHLWSRVQTSVNPTRKHYTLKYELKGVRQYTGIHM